MNNMHYITFISNCSQYILQQKWITEYSEETTDTKCKIYASCFWPSFHSKLKKIKIVTCSLCVLCSMLSIMTLIYEGLPKGGNNPC